MKTWQIREISQKTYKTFSDDLKLKMINLQFAFPAEYYTEVRTWLVENMNNPYLIDPVEHPIKEKHVWIKFTNEEDAVAFKLKWM